MDKGKLPQKLAIISSMQAAYFYLQQVPAEKNTVVVSTHPSVGFFLIQKGVDCKDISEFISRETFSENCRRSEEILFPLLKQMDRHFAWEFSGILGIETSLEWCFALYRTVGKYDFFGILNTYEAIQAICKQINPAEIVVYDNASFSIINPQGDLLKMVETFSKMNACTVSGIHIPVIVHEHKPGMRDRLFKVWQYGFEMLNYLTARKKRPIAILFESLYDLKFLKNINQSFSRIVWPSKRYPRMMGSPTDTMKQKLADIKKHVDQLDFNCSRLTGWPASAEPALQVLMLRIYTDLRNNITRYATELLVMQEVRKKYNIKLGIWGNDPILGAKALLVEYLIKTGTEVIGCQHGGVYGSQLCSDQSDGAYTRCTKFLSYGYNETDIPSEYFSQATHTTQIIGVGSMRIWNAWQKSQKEKKAQKEKIDIFYPATNNVSIMCSSQRAKVDEMTNLQKGILKIIGSRVQHNTVVKLPPYTNDAPSALVEEVADYTNIRQTGMKILDFMTKHDVRAVIIDANYSTCLIEVIPYECDIFVLHDDMIPYAAQALQLLKKRVHYCYTVDEFAEVYQNYTEGKLESKRDPGFMLKHVMDPDKNVRERIMEAMNIKSILN